MENALFSLHSFPNGINEIYFNIHNDFGMNTPPN